VLLVGVGEGDAAEKGRDADGDRDADRDRGADGLREGFGDAVGEAEKVPLMAVRPKLTMLMPPLLKRTCGWKGGGKKARVGHDWAA
jgi:hypothetical protein